ncbi:hypothetical protein A9Q84_00385 [Halobacteriovorax marinus]|uniref:DUF924 domain-containing protein n=1 Tax=Halobacteriovorax marinus TaxID=97084 RepID=A0A1Y5FBW4_9BACT|nr:hypothetical protein A9Q84_00385 [Halobacteriovorax marinus]
METTAEDILHFWFRELTPKQWFAQDSELDQQIIKRFTTALELASKDSLIKWRISAKSRLAEVILLDQFSRNIYRDTPKAFAQDELALRCAQEVIELGLDKELTNIERSFLYMPFMHSESLQVHQVAVKLFSLPGLEDNYNFELKHKDIIDRFGRYPHRNQVLGRNSTEEEIEFLKGPGSSF